MATPASELHLSMSPTDISQICGTTLSTVSGWRSRYDDFPAPTVGGHNPRFDIRSVETWVRSDSSPAQWKNDPSPEWWWTTAVEAFRTDVSFGEDRSSGDPLRPFLVAVVLLRSALHGEVDDVHADRKRWRKAERSDDVSSALREIAWDLERSNPRLVDLLVEPLSSITAPSASVHGLLVHLAGAETAGCTPSRLIDVLVDPSVGSDDHRQQSSPTARFHPRQQSTITATTLAHAVADMAAPSAGDVIYDPCCGEAQVVIECIRRRRGTARAVIQEIDPVVSRIARSRLTLDGVDFEFGQPGLSSLIDDQFSDLHAESVVLDPPVGGRKSNLTDWLDHALAHCSPDGRCVVAIPAHAVTTITQARRRPDRVLTERLQLLADEGAVSEVRVFPGSYRADVVGPITLWQLQPDRESDGINLIGESTDGTQTHESTTPTSLLDDIEALIPAASATRPSRGRPNRVQQLIRDVERLLDDLPTTDTDTDTELVARIRETIDGLDTTGQRSADDA
ncbi:SAM-dependent methyltransferase [bacterium]|nr:SAM-dependent methyltransferase [bacterium]